MQFGKKEVYIVQHEAVTKQACSFDLYQLHP